ncbi:MAG: hypothetical protein WC365_09130 [Candidatus Babeliales bacterium]|jgi:CelD/BcsL family acetyltransferase involved in cellulose biosynthesis
MTQTTRTTKDIVVFRMWKGEVIALFPFMDENEGLVNSYMHIGQHGAADYHGIVKASKPATPDEYKDLQEELTSIGYNLKIYKRKPNESWIIT